MAAMSPVVSNPRENKSFFNNFISGCMLLQALLWNRTLAYPDLSSGSRYVEVREGRETFKFINL
jgi:hypothetical protein